MLAGWSDNPVEDTIITEHGSFIRDTCTHVTMTSPNQDTRKDHPCHVPARIHSRRKQQLVTLEMFESEQDLMEVELNTAVFRFPKLDFGMSIMGKDKLKHALGELLQLHNASSANTTGVDHPNPQELTSDGITSYQSHRLAAVSWFANIVSRMTHVDNHQAVLGPAVNVMDRYITTCVDRGADLTLMLGDIGSVRAACISLSIKMYAVFTEMELESLCAHNKWATKALVAPGSTKSSGFNVYSLADKERIVQTELHILTTLQGAVFPVTAENTIAVLCMYLILTLPNRGDREHCDDLNRRAVSIAIDLLSKTTLDIRLLRFKRWACIAVCCLLGVCTVCHSVHEERLETTLITLLGELMPGGFTRATLYELRMAFTRECVVCTSSFVTQTVQMPDIRHDMLPLQDGSRKGN